MRTSKTFYTGPRLRTFDLVVNIKIWYCNLSHKNNIQGLNIIWTFLRWAKWFCHRSEDRLRYRQLGEPGPGHVQVPLDGAVADARLGLAGLRRSRRTSRMGLRLNVTVALWLWINSFYCQIFKTQLSARKHLKKHLTDVMSLKSSKNLPFHKQCPNWTLQTQSNNKVNT